MKYRSKYVLFKQIDHLSILIIKCHCAGLERKCDAFGVGVLALKIIAHCHIHIRVSNTLLSLQRSQSS